MALTKYSIYNACFRLLKEHKKKPTRSEVHDALGGGGSRTTIQKYMREWEEEHAATIAAVDGEGVTLPDPLMSLVLSIHEAVTADADAIAVEGIAAGDKRIDEANQLVQSAKEEAERALESAASEIAVAQAKVDAAQEERVHLLGRVGSLEDELSNWRDLARSYQDQITGLTEENRTLHENVAELVGQLRKAEQERASAESALNRLMDSAQKTERRLAASKVEADNLREHQAATDLAYQRKAESWQQEKLLLNRRIDVLSAHVEALEQHIHDSG